MKQKLTKFKGETDKYTGRDLDTSLSTNDGTIRQKIKDMEQFNYTINQQDLINIDRTLHPTTATYTFFQVPKETSRKTTSWAIKQSSFTF